MPPAFQIDKAWVLGQWPEDDPVAQVWKQVAANNGIASDQSRNIARTLLKITPKSFVLVRFDFEIAPRTVSDLLASKAKMVLYLPEGGRTIAPQEAVKLCDQGVVTTVLQRDGLPESFSRRLNLFYRGKAMYSEIQVALPVGKIRPDSCFVSSPYSARGQEFLKAAMAGLEGRGMFIKDPRDVQTPGSLGDKIRSHIHEVDFLVADTRIHADGPNRNVWLEIGIALGKDKTPVLCTYAADSANDAIPTVLHGVQHLHYWDELDLTMKLYWGFR